MTRTNARTGAAVVAALSLATSPVVGACSNHSTSSTSSPSLSVEGTSTARPMTCASAPQADTSTVDGWIGHLAEHPDDTAIVIDDGRGRHVEHGADRAQPAASAIKVVHLLAYARAVSDGRLDPKARVSIADWEKFYFGPDGGAHAGALARLGIPSDDRGYAKDRKITVSLDDLVSSMIQESDSAVPDYLRERLGAAALIDAEAEAGMAHTTVTSLLGLYLAVRFAGQQGVDLDALAHRYVTDPDWAETAWLMPLPDLHTQRELLAAVGPTSTAADLASMYQKIADGSFGEAGETMRRHLEWQPSLPDGTRVGFKGGGVPGIITDAFEFRRTDGTVATAVLMARGLEIPAWLAARMTYAWQALLVLAVTDPATLDRIACAA